MNRLCCGDDLDVLRKSITDEIWPRYNLTGRSTPFALTTRFFEWQGMTP